MKKYNADLLKRVKELRAEEDLLKGCFGLEKENVRVDRNGNLALTKHPESLGCKTTHPYITIDFSESQVEMITPPMETLEDCYDFLENIHDIVALELKDELLWPQSAPPILPEEKDIPVGQFDDSEKGRKAERYRAGLVKRYGKKKQMISGIHFNFSFKDSFLKKIYETLDTKDSFIQFKNAVYLKISRDFLKYAWLVVYLYGASPGTHGSYCEKCLQNMERTAKGDPYYKYETSLRNGTCGYRNNIHYILSYDNVNHYIEQLQDLIDKGEIQAWMEYYSPIRLKAHNNNDFMNSLLNEGISYLEIRAIDLNPMLKNGIDLDGLYLMYLLILYWFFSEDDIYTPEGHRLALQNYDAAASCGRDEGLILLKGDGSEITLQKWGLEVLSNIQAMVNELGIRVDYFTKLLNKAGETLKDYSKSPSAKILTKTREEGFIGYHLQQAEGFLEKSMAKSYRLTGYEDLELSTQILIKAAIKRGVKFEMMDRAENFIRLSNGKHIEYVKQATKTSLDAYITYLIMENKLVTKEVLKHFGLRVPEGEVYESMEAALKDYDLFRDREIVIKPKATNFGIGITIFKERIIKEDYEKALQLAFSHDNSVLIEEFIKGKEYRIFVLGDEAVGILNRVPANVIGDGQHNIRELVDLKNLDPLRGKGYKTPLEKITLGQVELMFLKEQGLTEDYIPRLDEWVYLRENSNISTGGDSIDYTDEVHEGYKKLAVSAAKAVGAVICGVDMMIEDIACFNESGYGIIELNFNPAIHIHCFPYKGMNRQLGDKLIEALGY